ncbi:hypothetical protein [Vibrio algivorus]|uniref:Uncharacterized protein n=1 Tax=Vibrio algivorus TaxID=1667024 RepID=A0A557P340_9VIBR|nr:hypothetical protein [Vibrio algivorus]TVO35080.1 hypothetical protein FOF44_12315 [Vibrio algivorus]
MISEDAQNKTDSILRQSDSDSMTQDEIDFANALGVTPESDCDCYKLAQNVLLERVSKDSNLKYTLTRLRMLADANECSLSDKQPVIKPARILVIGGGLS